MLRAQVGRGKRAGLTTLARRILTAAIALAEQTATRMNLRAKKLLLWLGFGIVSVAVLLLHFKQRDSYRCQTCFAKKDVFQWRVGFWMGASAPLSPQTIHVSETRLQQDFFGVNHSHDWKFAQGSPYRFFGTTWSGCALGSGRRGSDLCYLYERNDRFRDFIGRKFADGSLTQSNFLALAFNTDRSTNSPIRLAAEELMNAYFER